MYKKICFLLISGIFALSIFAAISMTQAATPRAAERGTVVSYTVQSAHNYANNYDYTWTITKSGASQMRVYFYRYQVETNYDYIYVMDKNSVVKQTLTSSTSKYYIWSVWVPGDAVKIRLKTDSSVTYYGFQITQYEYEAGTGDTTAPTTSITAPAAGATVSGTTTISASASDNVGVTQVDFYIDSTLVGSDTSSPYSYSWATTSYANGAHSIYSKAKDAAGNIGTSTTISVTVSNTVVDDGGLLTAGVAANGNMDSTDGADMWWIDVGASATSMYVVLTCGSADFDTYGKFNAQPTTASYDWRGYTSGGEENTVTNPAQGRHYIMVDYYSGSGAYQLTVTITYGTPPTGNTFKIGQTGNKYAVLVGISNYKSINDLSFCDEDVNDFYSYLTTVCGYPAANIRILGDGSSSYAKTPYGTATEANYKTCLTWLAGLTDAAEITFMTSGHGSGDGAGESYLCAWDCGAGESGQDGNFYDHEISDILEHSAAQRIFIFVDHCYSGGLGPEIMAMANKANVWMTTTCTANGYGYDEPSSSNGAWTNQFLHVTLQTHFGSSTNTTMEEAFTYAKSGYSHTGGDAPMQFDGSP